MIDQEIPTNGAATEELIQQAIQTLFSPDDMVEVRGKKLDKKIRSKFYADQQQMVRALAKANAGGKFEALWYTLQRLKPGIDPETKSVNGQTTNTSDILSYEWLVIDVDRKDEASKKLNATNEELVELHAAALRVIAWLASKGFPEPVLACSGNGWHILYKLNHLLLTEYPLLEDVLRAVWHQFLAEPVRVIDRSLADPCQVIKAYGTESRKTPADHPDILVRPWRVSYWESVPPKIISVTHSCLESVAALAPQREESQTGNKGRGLPLHPDFDEEAYWSHYEDVFVRTGTVHNGYQVTNICPITYVGEGTGHHHTGSTLTGIRFSEGAPEFHCFSDDHSHLSHGDMTRHLNQYHEPYPGPIWDHSEEDDHSDFAEPVDYEDAVPEAPPIKPNGHDPHPCPFGVHKAGECICTLSKEEVRKSAQRVKEENERRRPEQEAAKARTAALYQEIEDAEEQAETEGEMSFEDAFEEHAKDLYPDPLPEPTNVDTKPLEGTLDFPGECCMYGKLKEIALGLVAQYPDLELGWLYPSQLGIASMLPIEDVDGNVRSPLYVGNLGESRYGKSLHLDLAERAIFVPELVKCNIVPVSDRGLANLLSEDEPLRVGLVLDEMKMMMSKCAIDNSALAPMLCTFWNKNESGFSDKKKLVKCYGILSVVGNIAISDPAEFASIFGKQTTKGLAYRFTFGYSSKRVRYRPMVVRPTVFDNLKPVKFPKWVWDARDEWMGDKDGLHNVSENMLRIALITAALNGDREITKEGFEASLRFAEWQARLNEIFRPGVAETKEAEAYDAIYLALWEQRKKQIASGKGPEGNEFTGHEESMRVKMLDYRKVCQKKSYYRKYGKLVSGVRRDMLEARIIEEVRTVEGEGKQGKKTCFVLLRAKL